MGIHQGDGDEVLDGPGNFFVGMVEVHFADQTVGELKVVKAGSEEEGWGILREHVDKLTDLKKGYHFQAKSLKYITPDQADVLTEVAWVDTLPRQPQPWDKN